MYFLGFDTAKAKYDVSCVDEHGVEQWRDMVPNTTEAVAVLLLTATGHYGEDNLTCVVESTGCYHYPLLDVAEALAIPCKVYNPILTKQHIKSSVRGKKTDRTDALAIARLGLRGEGRLHSPEPYRTLKYYLRCYQKIGAIDLMLKLHCAHLTSVLDDEMSPVMQTSLEAVQESVLAARKALYADMQLAAAGDLYVLLQTIPGIGPYIAASLIGEIQDMQRFPSSRAVVAYSGLDPKIRQSGQNQGGKGRLTKRGSSYLRRSIFIAANVSRQFDPQFKALYDKKRAEGKSHTVATCVVARKLLAVVGSVWLSGERYKVPEN
ncbi:MAG TPA: IS110 family transposase [Candidatus Saccharimonadales bacterium]|nr:IS110 family transposase [Candidatus Saccharimonadales bacterium]